METTGKFIPPQSPWRWDEQSNELIQDIDSTAEKADINAETVSERIDLWNLPSEKRPLAYKKHPLEVAKDKKVVGVEDIVHVALNMVSDTYFVPDRFADLVKRAELEDFFLYLINYFYWYFEYLDSQVMTNPFCVELNHEERDRISNAEGQLNTALLFVAQKYSNIVLGTGLKQYHHFYWIEGVDEDDPLSKKREIIPYTGRVSRTLIDRGYSELLMIFATFVVWITFERKNFEIIRAEIGRIIRTNSFPNPTYSTTQVWTRTTRKATNETTTNGNNENTSNNMSERKGTATSSKNIRLQKTIATADVEADSSSNTKGGKGPKRQPFRRLLTQRSPVLVTLLPTGRDQSAWLFSRRNNKDNQSSKNTKVVPENEFKVQYEIGVLGQPIETLTLIVSGDTPDANASTSQMPPHVDTNRGSVEIDGGILREVIL
ncbi:unnamed protein product [Adineta steineri]|uniref:Uncharacterized protein n=1 Tax=Adineta steineri TaxID=433720 RepID=A0A818WDG9_9BILA|nr:unnamed protein product [Adineta steineri]